MARDDYYVAIYQILSYLYDCLKKGKEVNGDYLRPYSDLFSCELNNKYWAYIMKNLKNDGYITGIIVSRSDNEIKINGLSKAEITPRGISYLIDNNLMNKARKFIKDNELIFPIIFK